MVKPHQSHENDRGDQELKIQQQIAFASGLFHADITISTLLESLDDAVIVVDASSTILFVNAAAERIFGYARAELVGQPHAILIPERYRNGHAIHEAEYFERPKRRAVNDLLDLVALRRDGTEVPVKISLGYLETVRGLLVLAFISDMTVKKQYEGRAQESEKLFHIQLECVQGYAIYMIDPKGFILNWNRGAENLKGYRSEEIVGNHFSCLFPEEAQRAGEPEMQLEKARREGQVSAEGWRVRKDGSRFWANVTITAVCEEHGELRGFSIVTQDVTERKSAEEALRYSEARYRTLYRDNPTMIFTLDTAGIILSANPTASRQLGYSIEEMEGQPVLNIFHQDDRAAVAAQLQRCLQMPDQVHTWQLRKIRKDGRMLWVEETARVVHDLDGCLNVLVTCQDITERKRAEDDLRRSETKLARIFHAAPAMIAITTVEDGRCIDINDACLRTLGYHREEMIGSTLLERGVWESRGDRERVLALLQEHGAVHDMEIHFRDKYGRALTGLFSAEFLDMDNERYILSLVMDITERKRVEETLQRRTSELEAVFSAFPDLYFWVDSNERIIDYKGNVTEMFAPPEGFLGKRMQDVLPPEVGQRLHDAVQQVLQTKVPASADYWLPLPGREEAFEARLLPLPGHRVFFIVRNITERKRTAEEVERLNTHLAATNHELESFNYTVAHDLRKPLTVINGYSQIMIEACSDTLDDECKKYLQEIYEGTWNMNRLIDALLNFSRVSHAEPKREYVSLSDLCHEVASELKLAEPQRNVKFGIQHDVIAKADPDLLRIVLGNLLGNAWKYTGTREEAFIEFGTMKQDGRDVYFVRDNGVGFDPASKEKLFAPFRRLETCKEVGGLGIGLATVERVVKRHGGKVWAEGEPDRGATFYFTLAPER